MQCATLLLLSEISTQCGQPCGFDPDPHQGIGHSDRETGQGACDGTPQHENCPAGRRHAASPTAPPPEEQHQSTVSVLFFLNNNFLLLQSKLEAVHLSHAMVLFISQSPLDCHRYSWAAH